MHMLDNNSNGGYENCPIAKKLAQLTNFVNFIQYPQVIDTDYII